MARKNDAWGIELGADAIKAMRLVRTADGVKMTEYDVLTFKQILTTPDMNVDEAIQVNLDAFLSKHDLKNSSVVVSVPGNMAFARFAKLPPVDPKKIPDIVKFEAVQQIPFPIEQVEWDYQVFQQPDSPDVEVGIFAITKDRVMQWLSHFRRAGITVDGLTLSPLAVYNAFAYDMDVKEDDEGTILMDIGTSSTDVIIIEHGAIWLRTLPMGGNAFTEALVRAFKLSFPKAEKLKREAATSKYARQIFQAMRPVFADLVQEIQRSLGYYQSLNRDANLTKLVGVGSTFKLPGLQKFLKQQLQMEVLRPDSYERIKVAEGKQEADFAENAIKLSTAYGLALQGLGMDRVKANVLPSFILKQRMWRAKQPYIAAAAVLCLLVSGGAWYKQFADQAAYNEDKGANEGTVNSVISTANDLSNKWQSTASSADPRQRIENLRRILDYRDLWPKMMADITMAAEALQPQPETIAADYDAMKKIPRNQRRRIYIESISSTYLVQPPTATTTPGGPPAMGGPPGMMYGGPPEGFEMGWGEGPSSPMAPPPMMDPGAAGVTPPDASQLQPRFELRITGVTPFGDTPGDVAAFLEQGLVEWLKKNNERQDRPYKLVGVERPVVQISPVITPTGQGQSGPGGPPYGVTTPPPVMRTAPGRRGGMPPGAGFMPPGEMGMPAGGMSGQLAIADLLPKRPTDDEAVAGDHAFLITWVVELIKKPEDTRAREEGIITAPKPVQPAEQPAGETQVSAEPVAQSMAVRVSE